MACGAPELEAPMLMAHDEGGHCFFARQPSTIEETNASIRAIWASCCGAIRYGGEDRGTRLRLAELGLAEQCDVRLADEPSPATRDRASFEVRESSVGDDDPSDDDPSKVRAIAESLAERLTQRGSGTVTAVRSSGKRLSFEYEWGATTTWNPYRLTCTLEAQGKARWLLRLMRDDGHSLVSFAIQIHDALAGNKALQHLQWFTEEEWGRDSRNGHSLPY